MLSAICLNLDQSKILSSGNGLTKAQNFRLVKIESISRGQIQHSSDDGIFFVFSKWVQNIMGKGRNDCFQHFLLSHNNFNTPPFPSRW